METTAARIIYGRCSFEEIQTTNAWSACGIGDLFDPTCIGLYGENLVCVDKNWPHSYLVLSPPGTTISWNFPPQWNVTIQGTGNNILQINDFGYLPPYFPYTLNVAATTSSGGFSTMAVTLDECFTNCKECPEKASLPKQDGILFTQQGNYTNKATNRQPDEFLVENEDIRLYPNPASTNIKIAIPVFEEGANLIIYDKQGRIMIQRGVFEPFLEVDIQAFPSGLYFVVINTGKNSLTRSFVKIQ